MGIKKILVAAFSAGVILSLASVAAMADSTGWREDSDYNWRYYTSETEYVTNQWKSIDGNWYYFMDDGYALMDCWAYIQHKMYHFDTKGHMDKNKWIACGKHVAEDYDINGSITEGSSYYAGKQDYRYVGSDGAAYVGWKKIGGSWYYFSDDKSSEFGRYGLMQIGWLEDKDGSSYCFDGNGKMITGWFNPKDDIWFYFGSDGRAAKKWAKINGDWYWFYPYYEERTGCSCAMTTGISWGVDDATEIYQEFLLSDSGKLVYGWNKYDGEWYYSDSNGFLYKERWLKYNGNYYYFDYNGCMVKDANDYFVDGRLYNFNSSGICTNNSGKKINSGWFEIKGKAKPDYLRYDSIWVYIGSDGSVYRDKWLNYNGCWYYFLSDGMMASGAGYIVDNGKVYEFEDDGKCKNPNQHYTGWHYVKDYYENETWFYFGTDGRILTGWQKIDNNWYYFFSDGYMERNGTVDWGEGFYHFAEDGKLIIGWYKDNYDWQYSYPDGHAAHDGWIKIDGNWYFFEYSWARSSCTLIINDRYYDFDENAKCINPDGRPLDVIVIRDYDIAVPVG